MLGDIAAGALHLPLGFGVVHIEQRAPVAIAHRRSHLSRTDDVAKQHDCKDAVGISVVADAGEKLGDASQARWVCVIIGALPGPLTGVFFKLCVRDCRREVATVLGVENQVAAVHDEGRGGDLGKVGPYVDVDERPLGWSPWSGSR